MTMNSINSLVRGGGLIISYRETVGVPESSSIIRVHTALEPNNFSRGARTSPELGAYQKNSSVIAPNKLTPDKQPPRLINKRDDPVGVVAMQSRFTETSYLRARGWWWGAAPKIDRSSTPMMKFCRSTGLVEVLRRTSD